MKRLIAESAVALAAFAVCFFACAALFWVARENFANRVGYWMWLRASTEDQSNYFRLLFTTVNLPFAASIVAGVGGAVHLRKRALRRWRVRTVRRTNRAVER